MISTLPAEYFAFGVLPSAALSLVVGVLSATLFCLVFVRWKQLWRACALRADPLVWLLLTLPLIAWSLSFWFLAATLVLAVKQGTLPSLLEVTDCLSMPAAPRQMLFAVVVGWLSMALVWRLSGKSEPRARDTHSHGWRSWEIVLMFGLSSGWLYVAWLAQGGLRYDPELVELRDRISWFEPLRESPDRVRGILPAAFLENNQVQKMLLTYTTAKNYQDISVPLAVSPWLDFMRPRLAENRYWLDPETQEMGDFGRFFVGMSLPTHLSETFPNELPRLAKITEVGWISALVTLDQKYGVYELPAAVEKLELSGEAWDSLVEIGLSRADLAEGTPLDRDSASGVLADEMLEIQEHDEKPRGPTLASLLRRSRVNRLWRSLPPAASAPARRALDLATFRRIAEQDPFAWNSDPYALVVDLNVHRQEAVAALLLMELKRLRAEGQPLPSSASSLRPEIASLVSAYPTWITLEGDESEVRVSLPNQIYCVPRQLP